MERYKKNWGTFITEEQQQELLKKHILVIGCGGNAEYMLEYLARLGVRKITMFDGDVWEESNLNRQAFCTEKTIGQSKIQGTLSRLKEINSTIDYIVYPEYFDEQGAATILKSQDLPDFILYAADSHVNVFECRHAILQLLKSNIPMIDECVCENGAVITLITPDCLPLLYQCSEEWIASSKVATYISQPAYLCALAACLTVSEMVRFFSDCENAIINQRLIYNIHEHRSYLWDWSSQNYIE